MPFINVKTNAKIDKENECVIKSKLGEAMSIIGKSEAWFMLNLEDECNMYFKGENNDKFAMVQVNLFGGASSEAYNNFTQIVSDVLSKSLNISKNNIYVSYMETSNWGWNGNNF